jgi:hypothetical protein
MDEHLKAICGYLSIKFHTPVYYLNEHTQKLLTFSLEGNCSVDGMTRIQIARAFKHRRDIVVASRADSFLVYVSSGASRMKEEFENRCPKI